MLLRVRVEERYVFTRVNVKRGMCVRCSVGYDEVNAIKSVLGFWGP